MEQVTDKKRQLAKNLKLLFNPRTPNYLQLFEETCLLYRELYVLPCFRKLGIEPAKIEFVYKGMDKKTVGAYSSHNNTISINCERIQLYTGDTKVSLAFGGIMCVGHEGRHNEQCVVSMALNEGKALDKFESSFGYDIIEAGKVYRDIHISKAMYRSDEARTLLEFFPEVYKDLKILYGKNKNFEEIVEMCNEAIYVLSPIEIDARKVERIIMEQCANDMDKYLPKKSGYSDEVVEFCRFLVEDDRKNRDREERKYAPILKRIEGAFGDLKPASFAKFGKMLSKEQRKGFMAYQAGQADKEELDKIEFKKKTLRNAIKMFASKNIDFDNVDNYHIQLENLRKTFIKHGMLEVADIFKEEGFLDDYLSGEGNEYFDILTKEEVSKESFGMIKKLSRVKINELLISYLSKEQTEFVGEIIAQAHPDTIANLLSWSTATYRRKYAYGEVIYSPNDVEEIMQQNLLGELTRYYATLVQKQNDRKILFDDIDDFINLIAKFCKVMGIDYKSSTQEITGNSMVKEVKLVLLDLYRKAETLGKKQVELMLGYMPSDEDYRFGNAEDRKPYLLKGQNKELRIKRIYGACEYERVVTEREAEEEFLAE